MSLTKKQWKICEAVSLGLTHYYMDKNDRREVTEKDRKEATRLLPQLPKGWMNEEQEWMLHKIPHKGRKKR